MKKKSDPLWEIVGEESRLQGSDESKLGQCPRCGVGVQLPKDARVGDRFRCGLCGTVSHVSGDGSVADDGAAQIVQRLAE